MKVIEKHDRVKLGEGRNRNMGFAFLTKISDDEYHTVHAMSPCKDYLNDVVWSEFTNKEIAACGLIYLKTGIFDSVDYQYLGIKIMPAKSGTPYAEFENDKKRLRTSYIHIKGLLNFIEESLGMAERTDISVAEDDFYVIKVPFYWCLGTHRISLYTLLARMAQFAEHNDYAKFLEEYSNPLDTHLWKQVKPKYATFIKKKFVEFIDPTTIAVYNVHSNGVVALKVTV